MAGDTRRLLEEWRKGQPVPGADGVSLVRARLDLPSRTLAALQETLSDEEAARAAAFRFEADRDRYVAARGLLRHVIGSYLRVLPARVRFRLRQHGKPALSEAHGRPELRFNLAHSHDRALIALALDREVGVDLERVRDDLDHPDIAEHFLTLQEAQELAAAADGERPERFALAWTRMEAYAKATGAGLAVGPRAPDEREWEIVTLRPWEGYVAALAAQGHGWPVTLWEWEAEAD
ncbi:MAG TPA: 4'-phosphopantetheinyl transferase superfamily protein [Armatimonadota bacterium]|nr:4'-phosphopantetheinyl transferase superfamily protein [Armatimonadota bacterium]